MSDELSIEAEGETVGEAKWAAVRELERQAPGLDRESVRFQVVTEGERGLLGVGTTPARVIASAPVPPPVPRTEPRHGDAVPTTEQEVAEGILLRVLDALGVSAEVRVEERGDEVVALADGPDTGVLIGRHGQMLDAVQLLANAIAHTVVGEERRRIVIDAAGYRARRAATLEELAGRTAERVAASGQPSMLDPMSAIERRLVHEALKDHPQVETASEGTEPYRCVVVLPRPSA